MRSRLLRVAGLVLLLVAVLVAGLAVLTVLTAPLVIALELAAVAVVTGVATHRRRSRRRRAAPPTRHGGPATGDGPAGTEPEWTTGWAAEPAPGAVPAVRERLSGVLSGWGLTGEACEPTQLVVTELLDNVIAHACGPTHLAVRLVAGGVRVEVSDGSPDPPLLGHPDPAAAHGHGLVIVDGLADRWGWTDESPGKTVWAVVPPGW
jgi:anti-sigma regulatory factor (Ser/Thr protein kinase)